jgi:hypothetical protein
VSWGLYRGDIFQPITCEDHESETEHLRSDSRCELFPMIFVNDHLEIFDMLSETPQCLQLGPFNVQFQYEGCGPLGEAVYNLTCDNLVRR